MNRKTGLVAALTVLALVTSACSDDEGTSGPTSGSGGHGMGGMGAMGGESTGGTNAGGDTGAGGMPSGEAPMAPSGLTVEPLGAGLHITWMDESDDEDNFVIERKPADGAFAEVITLPFDSTSHHDEGGLTAGEAYTYRVGAENANGISYSAEVTATAP